ncbi:unnamed protein product [Phaedon cochleariae]|uniref:Uncharacterized protein n=1 Tax=Phaedon cochleariae TaxID=80249 RepID=A0A9N9S9J8_PHACE|nr:unnamed protein product [Phaedon cochleariae]
MSKKTTPVTISTDTATTAPFTSDESSNQTNSSTSKRTVSEILTPTSEDVSTFSVPRTDISRTKKQEQDDVPFTIGPEQLKNIICILNKQQLPCIIDAEQLKDLLENAHGSTDALSVSKDYTKDTTALIKLLTEVHFHTDDRSLKIRYTKLRKKLQKKVESGFYEAQSDSSDQLF